MQRGLCCALLYSAEKLKVWVLELGPSFVRAGTVCGFLNRVNMCWLVLCGSCESYIGKPIRTP